MANNSRRIIEEFFPVKEVSLESSLEKNIRSGHISTYHVWWARRPLSSSRVTNFSALVPAGENDAEREKQRVFLVYLSKWENFQNRDLYNQANNEIMKNFSSPPKVIDPFGGGGSIPLEAMKLGCETYSNDYNPVASFIQKCILYYAPLYRNQNLKKEEWGPLIQEGGNNALITDIKFWANWIKQESEKELSPFYPSDDNGNIPIAFLWSNTIPCQNPTCGVEIPLMGQYWLAKKKDRKIAFYPVIKGNRIEFDILGDGFGELPKDFDPDNGSISRAVVTCPKCNSVVDPKTLKKIFQEKKNNERLLAVVLSTPNEKGKSFRIAQPGDYKSFLDAKDYLQNKKDKIMENWGINPIPDEPTPDGKGRGAERAFSIRNYGINQWGDLFNPRQALLIITFIVHLKRAYQLIIKKREPEYAKAVISFIALAIDSMAGFTNRCARWENTSLAIKQLFSRQVISILWDYAESNPFSKSSGSWDTGWKYYLKVIENCINSASKPAIITQTSATNLPYPDNFFDAVFTDPPYYDNVPYSYLSDFFYVWLKRSVGDLHPELFSTPLTPKKNEIVAYSNLPGGFDAGRQFFEDMLKKAFQEMQRILKPDGISIIVYAHKSTAGWETLINSILDSGLVITGAWPINTEMKSRLRAKESAALASSIYIVARKMERKSVGFYNTVKSDLKIHLDKKLDRLWKEGISGADFFISAIGSAIEVYGKYEKVMDFEGNAIRADKLLDDVQNLATDYAVKQILHNGYGREISDLTRFYVVWRWNFGNSKVIFDEARKLAQSCNISLEKEWNRDGFIKKDKESISVLGPHERKEASLKSPTEMIDVLHKVLLLWESSKKDEMIALLKEIGFDKNEVFFRVAQAISETLPLESKEKKLLEGFLAGRERLQGELKKEQGKPPQKRLFK